MIEVSSYPAAGVIFHSTESGRFMPAAQQELAGFVDAVKRGVFDDVVSGVQTSAAAWPQEASAVADAAARADQSPSIETVNDQLAGRNGAGMIRVLVPKHEMTRAEALRHAAWLVVLADDNDEFGAVLRAVRNT